MSQPPNSFLKNPQMQGFTPSARVRRTLQYAAASGRRGVTQQMGVFQETVKKIVCFASGTGSLFEHVITSLKILELPATIVTLVTDQPHCGATQIAKHHHIPVHPFTQWTTPHRSNTCQAISKILTSLKPDLILLLGFMKILDDAWVKQWHAQTLNTHPALLPSFRGKQGVRDALQANVSVSGATLHRLVEALDSGEILWQRPVVRFTADTENTLHQRIKQVEKAQLIHAVHHHLFQD